MNRKFEPHSSSLGDLQANIVVLIIWLGPAIIGVILPNLGYLGLIIPVIFLLVEKKSELVRIHAGQSLALYIVTNIIAFILAFIVGLFAIGGALIGGAAGSADAGLAAGLLGAGIGGLIVLIVPIIALVFSIIACVKGWNWEGYTIPLVGGLGTWFTNKVKIN